MQRQDNQNNNFDVRVHLLSSNFDRQHFGRILISLIVIHNFFHFQKKIRLGIPLLGGGPLTLFYGGKDIIPHLSSASVKSATMAFYFLMILSLVLQLFLYIYKRYKVRKEIPYEQKLQQAVMSGVRNVYGQIFIFFSFLGFFVSLGINVRFIHFLEKNQQFRNPDDLMKYNSSFPFIGMIICLLLIFTPFIVNSKLRFEEFITFRNALYLCCRKYSMKKFSNFSN